MTTRADTTRPDPDVVPVRLCTADDSGLVATGDATPRLAWRLAADRPAVTQSGHEVQVSPDPDFEGDVVSSGFVPSTRPGFAGWPAVPLTSRAVRWWRVRVSTDRGVTA